MEVVVNKTHQDLHTSSSREPGVRCLLYEARTQQSIKSQSADEQKLVERLKAANPKMALAQIMEPSSERSKLFETKFGKSPQGSYASYQLSTTEDNFKVHCNISSVPRVDPGHTNTVPINAYPRFPLDRAREQFVVPEELAAVEKALLEKLCYTPSPLHHGTLTMVSNMNQLPWNSTKNICILFVDLLKSLSQV